MKRFFALLMMTGFSISSISAQDKNNRHLYWVVESNLNKRDVAVVKFYNSSDQLIHEVRIEGKILNIDKRRHKRMLDNLLRKYSDRMDASGKRNKSKSSI